MIWISIYVSRGRSSLSLGEFMSVIFTLITPEFKPVYFTKTEISALIFILMTNECKGFQNPLFNLFPQENGLYMD